ncbi:MAG: hypothetical protein EB060_09390 [Proteobacteria bacterium]|nr:hypothetical protein [Pseudomonadota bacterium]
MLGILAIARIYCSDDPQIGDRLAASLVAWQTFKSENPTGKKPKPVNHPEEALFVFTQAVPGKTYGMSIINPVLDLMPGYPGAEVIRQMCAIYDDKPRMELITPAELQGDDRMPPENTLNDRLFMSARTRLSAYHPMVGVLFAEVFSVPLNISAEALPGIRLNTALVFARDPVRSMTDEERIETYQRTVRINANFGNMVGKRSGSDDLPPRNG